MPKSAQSVMQLTLIVHPSFLHGIPESIIATELIQQFAISGKLTAVLLEKQSLDIFFQIERYNEGKLSVVQVAEIVGFRNAGRFLTAFARQMECTPKKD